MNLVNRKPIATILAIVFTITSLFFLGFAVLYNPSIQNFFSSKAKANTVVGPMETFSLPSQFSYSQLASEYFGEALCNLTTDALNVGNPISVAVTVALPTSLKNELLFLEVKINNAIMYNPFSNSTSTPMLSDMFMFPHNNSVSGGQTVIFETTGMVSMTIEIDYIGIESSTGFSKYVTNATFPNLQIGTGQEAQQLKSEDLNLSLTFFVLFFACVDIAVVFYDHSEKKENKANSETNEKNTKNNAKNPIRDRNLETLDKNHGNKKQP